ncbi:MAG: hypothetical protein RJA70_3991, partial [Pseudomonadota bacterium]
MTSAQTPAPATSQAATASAASPARTLRAYLKQQQSTGRPLTISQAVEVVVPICVELHEIHAQGYGIHVHPSNIVLNSRGCFALSSERAAQAPKTAEDRACLPPEGSDDELGDARASVYSIGAMLYELVTGLTAGVGMKRPSEVAPDLPPEVEGILAKALVTDPQFRPADLLALAQALYHLVPSGTIPPPPNADESNLDHAGNVDVDVSLSMLPPAPKAATERSGGIHLAVKDRVAKGDSATEELSALKSRLESDPTPRYVVVKQGMDHGPFSAVELLRQIANHTFEESDLLQDQQTDTEKLISEWAEFAPFADHARRHRDHLQEKVAIEQGVAQETQRTRGKAAIGLFVLTGVLGGFGYWYLTQKGTRSDDVAVQTDTVSSIEAEGDLKGDRKTPGGGKKSRVVGTQGGLPLLASGMSCEAAQATYVEEIRLGGGAADITKGQYSALMNSGTYFSHCGVPSDVAVSICAAVQNGRAVGVTVGTEPRHPSGACVS